jgi:protein required for attachment to host cells
VEEFMSNKRYILVADAGSARIFKSEGKVSELQLVHQQENPAGRKMASELDSDRAGSQRGGSGAYHGLGGDSDPQRHQAEAFAAVLARILHYAHQDKQFDELLIAAPPQFLGELRKHLSADCQKVLGRTVNKDLVRATSADISAHFS